jgi:hypothetical protein
MNTVFTNPFFRWIFGSAEKRIQTDGFRKTARSILERAHAHLIIKGKIPLVKTALSKAPAVIVANHPTSAAVLALIGTLEDRPDLHLIISSKFVGSSPAIDRHLIPAYIQHHFDSKRNPLIDFLFGKYLPGLTPGEEHIQNIKSIQTAATIVEKGGAVVLFPGYPDHDTGGWYSGVGHMLAHVNNKDVRVVVVHIDEHPWVGYLRLVPGLGFILPTITIQFLTVLNATDISGQTPKQITAKIEQAYRASVQSNTV